MSRVTAGLWSLVLVAPAVGQQPAPLATCSAPATSPNVEISRQSLYVPMPDGVKLAVDVYLPKGLAPGTRLPTVFLATRYWRAPEGYAPGPREQFWLSRGYANVYADVRGTGASFGQWYFPWSPQEVTDLASLVAWIAKQPWSDASVGAIGTSYSGNTAQLVAAANHPAVKAVVPRFIDFDIYADLSYPGGLINRTIVNDWGKMIHAMDLNTKTGNPPRGVSPVDDDKHGSLLAAALRDHQKNPPLDRTIDLVTYRDEHVAQFGGVSNDLMGTYRYRDRIERAGVPIFGWASWFDAGTAQGLLNRFMNWSNPQIAVVGPWSHGGGHHASPYFPPEKATEPSSAVQSDQAACFFDQFLKGSSRGMRERALIYYTLVEDKWKKTNAWPLLGTSMTRYYLAASQALSQSSPTSAEGSDQYRVDFDATTGRTNRWYTQLGGDDVVYPERTEADKRLLTYTSSPLPNDVEVTGQGIVTLRVASTAKDGNFIVYLEDVAPDGRVTYVTEGMLRALHRRVATATPPYKILYPYHTFGRKDGQPLVPGQVTTLSFQLLPTSILLKAGHRIRVAIAGADRDTFVRIPADGDVTITVHRSSAHLSFIELPVVKR